MGRVDHDRQVLLLRELELRVNGVLLGGGVVVEADLPNRNDRLVFQELLDPGEHIAREGAVVRLARVQRDAAKVIDPVVARPLPLEVRDVAEVVPERPGVRPRLAHPESGLHDGADPGEGHVRVVVRDTRDHVDVRIEDVHALP